MKIGIIIPDRGDRPEFIDNCIRMIKNQEFRSSSTIIIHVDNEFPDSESVDITKRYRRSYQHISDTMNVDVIAFMENDDWYSPSYIETILAAWEKAGRPDMFGTSYTVYYHLKLRKYMRMYHSERSCMMSTLMKPGLKVTWPQDNDPYTDQWLWLEPNSGIKNKVIFTPPKIICVGVKHGQGLCGGGSHTTDLDRYDNDDNGFLQNTLDSDSYEFYNEYSKRLNGNS